MIPSANCITLLHRYFSFLHLQLIDTYPLELKVANIPLPFLIA